MGGVDERVDAFGGKIVCEPISATEAADPHRHGLARRRRGAAGERQRHRQLGTTGKALRQASGFRGPAENEDAHVSS
jgi:hypothetical protein